MFLVLEKKLEINGKEEKKIELPQSFKMKAQLSNEDLEWDIPIVEIKDDQSTFIHKMAISTKIKELYAIDNQSNIAKQIMSLSIAFNIPCKYTSLMAVDYSNQKSTTNTMQYVDNRQQNEDLKIPQTPPKSLVPMKSTYKRKKYSPTQKSYRSEVVEIRRNIAKKDKKMDIHYDDEEIKENYDPILREGKYYKTRKPSKKMINDSILKNQKYIKLLLPEYKIIDPLFEHIFNILFNQQPDGSWNETVIPYLKSLFNLTKRQLNRKKVKIPISDSAIQLLEKIRIEEEKQMEMKNDFICIDRSIGHIIIDPTINKRVHDESHNEIKEELPSPTEFETRVLEEPLIEIKEKVIPPPTEDITISNDLIEHPPPIQETPIQENEYLLNSLWITMWVLVLLEQLSEDEMKNYQLIYEKSQRCLLFWLGKEAFDQLKETVIQRRTEQKKMNK